MYSNFKINNIPERDAKPRNAGITMVMDKGLSTRDVENLIEVAGNYIDIVKLGWATSFVTQNLRAKLDVYKSYHIPVYFGGTLLEAFLLRNQFDDFIQLLDEYDIHYAEVSDGTIEMEHEKKCQLISTLAKKVTVLSEVGSKDVQKIIPPYKWIELMQKELDAGAWKVIGEAREGGNVGLFRSSGEVRSGLVEEILTKIPSEKIIWEAPQKDQQVWFIKLLGTNVNLGNIAPQEVISLETLRIGLRSDTLDFFLNKK